MELKSYAKINLTLDILGKREDGYHEISSIMQEIDLHDVVTLSDLGENTIEVSCSDSSIPSVDNLVYKAAYLLKQTFHLTKGVHISVQKNIPIGAGLGGGSSNAAAVLKGLNMLWDLKLSSKDLIQLGSQLGSDVPFFIQGKSCLVEGRGDLVTPVSLPSFEILLVIADFSISTQAAYEQLRKVGKEKASEKLLTEFSFSHFHNDFEESLFLQYPRLKAIKEELLAQGASAALVSGSGSCVYGVYSNAGMLRAHSTMDKKYKTLICKTI